MSDATPTPKALRAARNALSDMEQMIDAQKGCVPCKLCGGHAVISDAGTGAGYYVRCSNSVSFRDHRGCLIDMRRLGGWAYNVMEWWNRLHATPTAGDQAVPAGGAFMRSALESIARPFPPNCDWESQARACRVVAEQAIDAADKAAVQAVSRTPEGERLSEALLDAERVESQGCMVKCADLRALMAAQDDVADAFLRLCETLGVPATAGAHLEMRRILAAARGGDAETARLLDEAGIVAPVAAVDRQETGDGTTMWSEVRTDRPGNGQVAHCADREDADLIVHLVNGALAAQAPKERTAAAEDADG